MVDGGSSKDHMDIHLMPIQALESSLEQQQRSSPE